MLKHLQLKTIGPGLSDNANVSINSVESLQSGLWAELDNDEGSPALVMVY